MRQTILVWNCLPQVAAGLGASVSDNKGDHLTTLATERNPNPAFSGLL